MSVYYAGIGSRETPDKILEFMTELGKYFSCKNYILRSGGAEGADSSFEKGCDLVNGNKEIYLPWYKFNNSNSNLVVKQGLAFEIAKQFHPYYDNLSEGAKKLQARNTHQVLGLDFKTYSNFIICYTKNGSGNGGTGQAIRIANHFNISVLDLGKYNSINEVKLNTYEFLRLNNFDKLNRKCTVVNRHKEEYDIYIGRGTKWGNPFEMKNNSIEERNRVCNEFEKYFWTTNLPSQLFELKGKRLGCSCKPLRCHGDFLANEVNKL
jgi:hypothetical protein